MRKQLISALCSTLSVVLFAATSGAAVAGHGHDGGGHDGQGHDGDSNHHSHRGAGTHEAGDPGRMVRHLTRMLELDETQQQQIDNVVSAAKPEMDALWERAAMNRKAMHELDVNDGNHDAKLNELALEKGAIATEHALPHGRLKSEINAVLTPEQRQQLSEDAEQMRDR